MATAKKKVEEAPESTQESNGENKVVKTAHNVVLAGLGAAAYGKEEFATVFERLVEKGEVTEKENRERFGEMFDRRRNRIKSISGLCIAPEPNGRAGLSHRAYEHNRYKLQRVVRLQDN